MINNNDDDFDMHRMVLLACVRVEITWSIPMAVLTCAKTMALRKGIEQSMIGGIENSMVVTPALLDSITF